MSKKINVTIWNEYRHERSEERIREIYPEGIHGQVAKFLGELDVNNEFNIRTATLDEPQNGLPDEVLNDTDVLLWWGHIAHHEVPVAFTTMAWALLHCTPGITPSRSVKLWAPQVTCCGATTSMKSCGTSMPHIPLPPVSVNTLTWNWKKCMANRLPSHSRMSWYS